MIDLHTHILPGVDDGPRNLEGSLDMARAAAADGVEVLAATPHVRDDYPTDVATMERGVDALREALRDAGIALELRPGAELALDRLDQVGVDELRRFGLGGNPAALLLEFPYVGWPLNVAEWLFRLIAAGFTPVLAHPERNAEVIARPGRLEALVEAGAVVQLTAASLDGRLGDGPRRTALRLIDARLAHLVASDAHGPGIREIGMSAAADAVGGGALAHWLTHDVPAALLAGGPLPPRPSRRRWRRRR